MVLLTLLAAVTIGIIRTRSLFAVVVLLGAYSFLMASVMIVLDAVDVAMTEASVGAGISTVLVLGTLYLTKVHEAPPRYTAHTRRSTPMSACPTWTGRYRRPVSPTSSPRS